MEKQSEKMTRKKKFLLVLPLIALPFITLAFWGLGGGRGKQQQDAAVQQGINKELPGAQLESGTPDKMSLYGKSELDSPTLGDIPAVAMGPGQDSSALYEYGASYDRYGQQPYGSIGSYGDPNERKVQERLAELEKIMAAQGQNDPPYGKAVPENEASAGRLGQMMEQMNTTTEPDPELQTLDNMLDKIMDIQNPERAKEKIRAQSLEHQGTVYAVARTPHSNSISMVTRNTTAGPQSNDTKASGFYHVGQSVSPVSRQASAIPAVVHETQTLVSGANIKLRLTEDIYVNGILIPAGRFVTGACSLEGERLQVKVSGIRYGNYLLPVRLAIFDLDGMEGIRIPGTISRDAAKEGTDRALQSVQFMTMDQSFGAQAASAGVEAAKNLLSKKVRLIKVTVKAGHPVLLFDEQSNKQ